MIKSILYSSLFCCSFLFSQKKINDNCLMMKSGSFLSIYDNQSNLIEIKDSIHFEKNIDKTNWIKSKLTWINNCEFKLVIEDLNYPNYPFVKGEKMIVKIDSINFDKIYYKAFVKEDSVSGVYKKIH